MVGPQPVREDELVPHPKGADGVVGAVDCSGALHSRDTHADVRSLFGREGFSVFWKF